jgi:glycosyltransferase involved in cell wall biosynthesis
LTTATGSDDAGVSSAAVQVVGIVVVHNEDVYVERAVRNVVDFCDRIHIVDHLSNDATPEIVRELAREFDHVDVRRTWDARVGHRVLEPYVGTKTWVIGVDGDELFDPAGLGRLRPQLEGGRYDDAFFLKAHVLNCDRLDVEQGTAAGWMAPPSRPVTKLYNFDAVTSWTNAQDKLEGGTRVHREGFSGDSVRRLFDEFDWDEDPLRMLHLCFLRRSSKDEGDPSRGRLNIAEQQSHRRGVRGAVYRALRRPQPNADLREAAARSGNWKSEKFKKGAYVEVDATPFLARSSGRRAVADPFPSAAP